MDLGTTFIGLALIGIGAILRSVWTDHESKAKYFLEQHQVFVWMPLEKWDAEGEELVTETSWVPVQAISRFGKYGPGPSHGRTHFFDPEDAFVDDENKKYRDRFQNELEPLDAHERVQEQLNQIKSFENSSSYAKYASVAFFILGGLSVAAGLKGLPAF